MSDFQKFPFDREKFDLIKSYKYGRNWPVVYIIKDDKEIYIGETINVYFRSKQHLENPERKKLKEIYVITDDEFNVSATLDIESWLIQYISADERYMIQNSNGGLKNHNYYDREKYKTKFEMVWDDLRKNGIVKNTLEDLKNSDLFKYSPYKSLTDDQLDVSKKIFRSITTNKSNNIVVHGKPGTGKTILATYLFKYIKEQEKTKKWNIGLVVPMSSLRKTIKSVFRKIKGLKANMVIGPNEVIQSKYDILIVDESHRLQRRQNIMGYGSYDEVNRKLGLSKNATQLDWIMKSAKHRIFFYDEQQSIKPSDVRASDFKRIQKKEYYLYTQMRVGAGTEYINFIEDIFDLKLPKRISFDNYDFKLFDSIHEMVGEIKAKDRKHKLSRIVAGYAWPWHTKPNSKSKQVYDIEINGLKLIWNSTAQDWVNSPNAINEVGCIHTVQGYDLNYVGVIIGPEFYYDVEKKKFCVDKEKYFDINGRNGISDPNELERYIINIYKTLLTRGINGTYIYIVDDNLRNYFKKILSVNANDERNVFTYSIDNVGQKELYFGLMISVPLFESVGCGNLKYADSTVREIIQVPTAGLSKNEKYFVLRTSGDSMDKVGINDGDLVLCRKTSRPKVGDIVVALIGDDATIKEYHLDKKNIILKPRSSNLKYESLKFKHDGEIKIQGVVVRVLKN